LRFALQQDVDLNVTEQGYPRGARAIPSLRKEEVMQIA
jgi:hypothetical protein